MAGFFDYFMQGKQLRQQEQQQAQQQQYQSEDRDMRRQQFMAQQQQAQNQQREQVGQLVYRGAQAIANARPEQRPVIYAGIRAELARHPEAQEWIAHLPDRYDPATVDPVVQQVMAQTGLYAQPEKDARPSEIQTLEYLSTHPELAKLDQQRQWARAQMGPQAAAMYRDPPQPRTSYSALSPQEVQSLGLPPGTVAQRSSDGQIAVVSKPDTAKTAAQAAAAARRNQSAADTAGATIETIDRLVTSPGYKALGTITGDFATNVPYFRTDAKDSQGQLDVLAGQIALSTMSSLKALSAQGATGFGALNKEELKLLQNAVASLQAGNLSHKQLDANIQVVREKMAKIQQAAVDAVDGVEPDQAANTPREIQSQAEYDALPSGAIYLEDGKQYRKP